jgi:nitroreductase
METESAIRVQETPAALGREVFVQAVEAAVSAPSMYNSQPWRFRLAGAGLEVWADPSRRLPVADRSGWATRLACGAAAANAQLALAVAGIQVDVRLRPEPDQQDLLVRLVPAGRRPATPGEVGRYAAIPRRHSNRRPFTDTPVPSSARAALRAAAQERGAWLELLVGRAPLALVAEIVAAADGALRRDDAYQRELVDWSRRETGTGHGIPLHAAGFAPAGQDLLAMRDFGGPPRGWQEYESDPLVAVLGTAGDTPDDQLVAGMALQDVLLTATELGLAASLLSQPIEVPAAREQLRLGLGRYAPPQIVARIGYGPPGAPSPRRPVTEVISDT